MYWLRRRWADRLRLFPSSFGVRMESTPPISSKVRIASAVLAALALLLVLWLRLLPALLAGLLVYELVQSAAPLLGRRISGERARMLVVAVLGVVVTGLLILLALGTISLIRHEIGNPEQLWQDQLMPLVDKARQQLPASLTNWLPDSVYELRNMAAELTHKHAGSLQMAGKETARTLVHIIIGLVLGAMVALSHARPVHNAKPLAAMLRLRSQRLLEAFLSHNSIWKIIGALNFLHHNHYEELKKAAPFLSPEREPGSFYIQKIA